MNTKSRDQGSMTYRKGIELHGQEPKFKPYKPPSKLCDSTQS